MKSYKRARRRHDLNRMKAKAVRIYRIVRYYDNPERAKKHADYMAVCSCSMCGNPRRHFGRKTLAELRFAENHDE